MGIATEKDSDMPCNERSRSMVDSDKTFSRVSTLEYHK